MELIIKDGVLNVVETIVVENEINSTILISSIETISNQIEVMIKRKEELSKLLEEVLLIENKE